MACRFYAFFIIILFGTFLKLLITVVLRFITAACLAAQNACGWNGDCIYERQAARLMNSCAALIGEVDEQLPLPPSQAILIRNRDNGVALVCSIHGPGRERLYLRHHHRHSGRGIVGRKR